MMSGLSRRLRALWHAYNNNPRRHVLEAGLIGLSFLLMARALAGSLSQLNLSDIQFDVRAFLSALILTFLSVLGGTLGWAHIVRAWNPKTPYLAAIRYHLISMAAKYLPGFGWQQVSKVVQLNRGGASLALSALPVTLELAIVIIAGAIIGALCFTVAPNPISPWPPTTVVTLILFSLVAFIALPLFFSSWISRKAGYVSNYVAILLNLFAAEALIVLSWLFLGVGLWFTSRIFYETSYVDIPYFITSVVIGFIVSLAVIFVPNGWGVRELTLSVLLQAVIPSSIAVVSSIMFRVVIVMVEISFILPILMLKFRRRPT
jgi:glycosyltransferase 2 family protein